MRTIVLIAILIPLVASSGFSTEIKTRVIPTQIEIIQISEQILLIANRNREKEKHRKAKIGYRWILTHTPETPNTINLIRYARTALRTLKERP